MGNRAELTIEEAKDREAACCSEIEEYKAKVEAGADPSTVWPENVFCELKKRIKPEDVRRNMASRLAAIYYIMDNNFTDTEREVFILQFRMGLSPDEIAAKIGKTIQRVRSASYRAVWKLNYSRGRWMLYLLNGLVPEVEAPTPITTIEQLDISQRAFNGLNREGIVTISEAVELLNKDPVELWGLRDIRNIGMGTVNEILDALKEAGVSYDSDTNKWVQRRFCD